MHTEAQGNNTDFTRLPEEFSEAGADQDEDPNPKRAVFHSRRELIGSALLFDLWFDEPHRPTRRGFPDIRIAGSVGHRHSI